MAPTLAIASDRQTSGVLDVGAGRGGGWDRHKRLAQARPAAGRAAAMPATPRGVTDRDSDNSSRSTCECASASAPVVAQGHRRRHALARHAQRRSAHHSRQRRRRGPPRETQCTRVRLHRLPEGVPMPLTQTQLSSSLTAPRSLTPRPPGDRRARGDYAQGARQRPEAADRRPDATVRARQTVAEGAQGPQPGQPTRRARAPPSQRIRARPLTKATAALPSVQKAADELAAPTA
jgi:hypothetical protein